MPRLALLIDAENVGGAHFAEIDAKVRSLGDPVIKRLFGDFTEGRLSGWLDVARQHGLEPVLQLNGGRAKNSTDMALAINAMDVLYSGAVDAFCLVSNDRDFLPLATRLRGSGKRVYGFVIGPVEARFKAVFSDLFELAAPKSTTPTASADQSIVAAFRLITANGPGEMTLAAAGIALRKHDPSLLPPPGKSKLRKLFQATGAFSESGAGAGIKVRLKPG
jgi:NYN domain